MIPQESPYIASEQASSLWAKTGSKEEPAKGLSLAQHMTDAGSVAARLWDSWLSTGVKRRIASMLDLTEEEAKSFTCWVAATHDIGKATPEFAGQLDSRGNEELRVFRTRIEECGFDFPQTLTAPSPIHGRCPHSTYSQSILIKLLQERYNSQNQLVARTIASIAGAHHGVPAKYTPGDPGHEFLIFEELNPRWGDAWHELFEMTLEQTGANPVLEKLMAGTEIPVSVQFYLTGVVIVADWVASNPEFFPMGVFSTEQQHERQQVGWNSLGFERAWEPNSDHNATAPDLYSSRFGWQDPQLRPMQQVAVEAARSMTSGGMMCIEAPMGQGKTEAGLIAAEILAQYTGRSGLAFAAPTQATSNALFDRVKEWAKGPAGGFEPHTMFLGHSKNQQVNSFRFMPRADVFDSETETYPDSRKILKPNASLARHSWLSGRKRGILSTFVVCTIDQVLMLALQSRHVMLRHLGLGSKVVIIDEVHAYDAYMGEYLKEALYWLGQLNAPVILMSATLPAHLRSVLMESYAAGNSAKEIPLNFDMNDDDSTSDIPAPIDLDYPVIHTITPEDDHTPRKWSVSSPEQQVEVAIRPIEDDFTDLEDALAPLEHGHGCAAVICNTVGRAQEAYNHLRARFGEDVVLTHSRFLAKHRSEQEELLVSRLGPQAHYGGAAHGGTARPDRMIVVGTQVIEQSLDLDFDVMVTDFAPVDLVLQRLGRLHRHNRDDSERPAEYRSPICYVRGIETFGTHDQAPEFPQGTCAVYKPAILLSSYAQLLPFFAGTPLRIPADMSALVQGAYSESPSYPASWQEAYDDAHHEFMNHTGEAQSRAKTYLMKQPQKNHIVMADTMGHYIRSDRKNGLSEEQIGEARVRDTDSSLEVIALVVERDGEGNISRYRLVPGPTDDHQEIHWYDANATEPPRVFEFLASSIRLPYQFSDANKNRVSGGKLRFDAALDQLEKERIDAWRSEYLLAGELILPLELQDSGVYEVRLCDHLITYSPKLGLQAHRIGDEH